MSLEKEGILSLKELAKLPAWPSAERLAQGPVAIIECAQEIPCNPCEEACRQGAIAVGEPITNLPLHAAGKCTGCGLCIPECPGQAIFVVDLAYSESEATVQLPREFLPLPATGEWVDGLNRAGEKVCAARVVKVLNPKAFDRTPVITVAVPKEYAMHVRNIALRKLTGRTAEEEPIPCSEGKVSPTVAIGEPIGSETAKDLIICRCEEVSRGEILQAIGEGARTLVEIKWRTRAGMGLCQAKTCRRLVSQILAERTGQSMAEIDPATYRPPVRPVKLGIIASADDSCVPRQQEEK